MRSVIGIVAMVAMLGCGRPPVDQDPEVDAGAVLVDGGTTADGGEDICTTPAAIMVCARTLQALEACCGVEFVAPTPTTFCDHLASGDADPLAACKNVAVLPCADVASEGFCYGA